MRPPAEARAARAAGAARRAAAAVARNLRVQYSAQMRPLKIGSGTVVTTVVNQSKMRPPSTAIADDPTRALLRQALEDNGVAFVNAPRASPGEDRAQATRGRSNASARAVRLFMAASRKTATLN